MLIPQFSPLGPGPWAPSIVSGGLLGFDETGASRSTCRLNRTTTWSSRGSFSF